MRVKRVSSDFVYKGFLHTEAPNPRSYTETKIYIYWWKFKFLIHDYLKFWDYSRPIRCYPLPAEATDKAIELFNKGAIIGYHTTLHQIQ